MEISHLHILGDNDTYLPPSVKNKTNTVKAHNEILVFVRILIDLNVSNIVNKIQIVFVSLVKNNVEFKPINSGQPNTLNMPEVPCSRVSKL